MVISREQNLKEGIDFTFGFLNCLNFCGEYSIIQTLRHIHLKIHYILTCYAFFIRYLMLEEEKRPDPDRKQLQHKAPLKPVSVRQLSTQPVPGAKRGGKMTGCGFGAS